jgi:Zn-dependent M28 family amino/carboxypeptidase
LCLILGLVFIMLCCNCAAPPNPYIADIVSRMEERELRKYSKALAVIGSRPWYNHPKSDATVQFIEDSLRNAGYQVRSTRYADSVGQTEHINIIAEIRGISQPNCVVELAAHYDTVPFSPGADDNGSGVVGVIAVAHVSVKMDKKDEHGRAKRTH